jgi:hypothetical protein
LEKNEEEPQQNLLNVKQKNLVRVRSGSNLAALVVE